MGQDPGSWPTVTHRPGQGRAQISLSKRFRYPANKMPLLPVVRIMSIRKMSHRNQGRRAQRRVRVESAREFASGYLRQANVDQNRIVPGIRSAEFFRSFCGAGAFFSRTVPQAEVTAYQESAARTAIHNQDSLSCQGQSGGAFHFRLCLHGGGKPERGSQTFFAPEANCSAEHFHQPRHNGQPQACAAISSGRG